MVAKVDGNSLRTQRTRARVLDTSLALFNERGEPHVTTGTIATEVGISPGNLYYHFRSKDQVIEELFARFEQRVSVGGGTARGVEALEDLWLYLHLMLEAIWDYRFLYRNLDELLARNRRLRERFSRVLDGKRAAVTSLCAALVEAGAMRARPREVAALATNVVVLATYWLNFRALPGIRRAPAQDIGEGAYQVMAMVAPYLVGAARTHLERLGRTYID